MEGSTRSSKSSPSCCARRRARERQRRGARVACAAPHRVDARQLRNLRARQHSQRQVHLLQVCAGVGASAQGGASTKSPGQVHEAGWAAGVRCAADAGAAARVWRSSCARAAVRVACASRRPAPGRTFCARDRADAARPRADVEDDSLLQPRHQEVRPLARRFGQHALQPVKQHGSLASVDCALGLAAPRVSAAPRAAAMRRAQPQRRTVVHGRLRQRGADAQDSGPARQVAQQSLQRCGRGPGPRHRARGVARRALLSNAQGAGNAGAC